MELDQIIVTIIMGTVILIASEEIASAIKMLANAIFYIDEYYKIKLKREYKHPV